MTTLIERVKAIHQSCDENPELIQGQVDSLLEKKRNQACVEATEEILSQHDDKIINTATMNKKSVRIYEWCHSDQARFNGCYLRDLLNRGSLLSKLQTVLDEENGSGNFKIYHTILKQRQVYRTNERRYAIYISWDQSDFERLDKLIAETRERFSLPPKSRSSAQESMNSEAETS